MASIYSIAKQLGVSSSTVARALRPDSYCSPQTRMLVQEEAKRQGYIPSDSARSLRNKRTGRILFCIPDIYNTFYFGMIQGASEILEQFGYYTLLCHTNASLQKELQMVDNLRARVGDGMIFVSFDFVPELVAAINSCASPVVLTNMVDNPPPSPNYDCVFIDTYEGVRMAVKHLIQHGHTRIAYIGGDIHTHTGKERCEGYLSAMKEAGLPPFDNYDANGQFTKSGGFLCASALLRKNERPTAIMAANDLMALGVIEACREIQLRIPEDISLIGMDNTTWGQFVSPPISSVTMREDEIGRMAATLLMERIQNPNKQSSIIRLSPDLVVRESSNFLPDR